MLSVAENLSNFKTKNVNTAGKVVYVNWGKHSKNLSQIKTNKSKKVKELKVKRPAVNGTVDPLSNKEDIQAVKDYFLKYDENNKSKNNTHGLRNWCMFSVNICIGLRAGDLLSLTISDIVKENGVVKDRIIIREEKTTNRREIYLSDNAKNAIKTYLEYRKTVKPYKPDDFLFESNKCPDGISQPINVRSCWRIMNEAGKALGLDKKDINLGTHSMRKTFGTQFYKANAKNNEYALEVLSEMFGHSSPKITRKYIGLTSEIQKELYMKCNF